ncbi:hypothetical protein [Cohaesibacter marisflavi]|uniref:hypothetical protein n=1 Tax=Cohaesibacter marisflavi TaxID=655353 RepID=UPI0029C742C2|nr:hypothetical protein [Cohaesibacter marisflavi]
MGVDNWSTEAAGNAIQGNSDWSEGMSPADVNDSARDMMAQIARMYLDLSGDLLSSGSGGVHALATNTGFTQLKKGLRVTFKANVDFNAKSTLNVDGLGAKRVSIIDENGERALVAGDINVGGFYDVVYNPNANGGAGAWVVVTSAFNLEIADIAGLTTALATKVTIGDYGIGQTDVGFSPNIADVNATDTPAGSYNFTPTTTNVTSLPFGSTYGKILIRQFGNHNLEQLVWRNGSNIKYYRLCLSGVWGSWSVMFGSTNVVAGDGVAITEDDGTITIVADNVSNATNAAKLGGSFPAFYRNASNLNAGTVPEARLPSSVVLASANTFNALQNKDAGTGEYSTSGNLVSGRGSGGVALTVNDGQGNANITFNHKAGIPEQDGNSARIVHNSDATTGSKLTVELASGVTGGESVNTTEVAEFSEGGMKVLGSDVVTKADYGAGKGVNADLLDGQHGNYYAKASDLEALVIPGGADYVSDVRLGAIAQYSQDPANYISGLNLASGFVMTNIKGSTSVQARPVQKRVNGTWYTVSEVSV